MKRENVYQNALTQYTNGPIECQEYSYLQGVIVNNAVALRRWMMDVAGRISKDGTCMI